MDTKELVRIVNLLMVAVERKAVVSQYDHVVFYGGAISTFNGKIFISHPVDLDLECSVPAEDLLNVLKTVEDKEVSLTVDGNLLKIKSNDVEAELSTDVYEDNVVKTIKYLDIGKFTKDDFKETAKEFIQALSDCRFSVGKDVSCDKNSFCIHVIEDAVESTDGYRCSEYIMDAQMDEMLLPVSAVNSLLSFAPVYYVLDNGWAHFIDDNGVFFSVSVVKGKFSDVPKIMERAKAEGEVALPIQIANILSEFGKLSSGETDIYKFMEVEIKGKQIICKTDKQGCSVKKKIPFPESQTDLTFLISPTLLNSVLSKTNTIGINYASNMASFSSKNFTHVMVLPEGKEVKEEDTGTGTGTGEEVPF